VTNKKHDVSHGYKVADSTRYPLFPSPHSNDSLVYKGSDDKLWTIEEDLRLLEGISTLGLGNWIDISDVVGKNPRRCMERYFDDFLGRYGHILPKHMWMEEEDGIEEEEDDNVSVTSNSTSWSTCSKRSKKPKRNTGNDGGFGAKLRKYTRMETDSVEGYDKLWTDPYLPEGVAIGEDVNRDVQYRAEQSYVKALASTTSQSDADQLIHDMKTKTNAPKVFPPRIEDIRSLPGSDLAGYMPRRGDFDVEWDNDAESLLADMEFSPNDHPNERQLKIEILQIYNSKLDERERRKTFIKDRNLLNYRKTQLDERAGRERDEKDLLHRMRLFARFHSPEEHEKLCREILEAKRLRKEIAQLQHYHSLGFTSLSQVEQYENDRNSRDFHKVQIAKKPKKITTTPPTPTSDNLLSQEEVTLCHSIDIAPKIYLEVKRVLIDQSVKMMMMMNNNNESSGGGGGGGDRENHLNLLVSNKVLMMLDVEKRGQVVDFVFRAGWIQCKPTFVDG